MKNIKQIIILGCVFGVVAFAAVTRLILLYRKERHRAKQKLVSKDPGISQQERPKLPDEFSMKHRESITEG
ncbi:UNVERIFIED_CONTAM: hypothetical protein H355_016178 [Colinus virginianus]|nr:hypothetical protein H355_016178 [Colinus virginianus]